MALFSWTLVMVQRNKFLFKYWTNELVPITKGLITQEEDRCLEVGPYHILTNI